MKHTREQQAQLAALLAACKAEPDEVERRGVLADWLEEHGAADLAECVRLSLAAEGLLADDPCEPGYAALLSDARRPAGRWLAPLRKLFPHTTFHRGLLRVAATNVELLRHRPDDVPAEHRPWLETLAITRRVGDTPLAALADAGWLGAFTVIERLPRNQRPFSLTELLGGHGRSLGHVASLHLEWGLDAPERLVGAEAELPALRSLALPGSYDPSEASLRPLLQSPLLGRLTSLHLGYTGVGPETVRVLARSQYAGRLRYLNLDGGELDREALAEIGTGPGLRGLRSLSLIGCRLTADQLGGLERWPADHPIERLAVWDFRLKSELLAPLARWPALNNLRHLKIDPRREGPAGWIAFTRALARGRLESLQLDNANLTDDAARALADCPGLAHLRALCLQAGHITPEGLALLARSPHLQRLEFLGLLAHRLGEAGYRALTAGRTERRGADISPFPHLQSLDLSETRPASAGLALLLRSPLMARLRHLHLRNNRLGPAGARAIAAAPAAAGLKFLSLWTCSLKDEGAEALAGSPHLAGLRGLDLQKNNLTDRAALALARSPHLAGLSWLSVRLNKLSDAGVLALANRPGGWGRLAVDHNDCGADVEWRAEEASVLG